MPRIPALDPRTVARDIPGVLEIVFPQPTPTVVMHLNRRIITSEELAIPEELVASSTLQKSMLFEIGFVVGEMMLRGNQLDWDACLKIASNRQRRHFDARVPDTITPVDETIATIVGENIRSMTLSIANPTNTPIIFSPVIPGYEWIACGNGDFAAENILIEIKCANGNFSASDYRQVLMYWLLSFSAAIESGLNEWKHIALLNPRLGKSFSMPFEHLLEIVAGGRTKVEILEIFSALVGARSQ